MYGASEIKRQEVGLRDASSRDAAALTALNVASWRDGYADRGRPCGRAAHSPRRGRNRPDRCAPAAIGILTLW
jgi:hypothetical protein